VRRSPIRPKLTRRSLGRFTPLPSPTGSSLKEPADLWLIPAHPHLVEIDLGSCHSPPRTAAPSCLALLLRGATSCESCKGKANVAERIAPPPLADLTR